ncbi:hypothetical protein PV327_002945 [Microctonus hyperodae]|uniref:HAT C-terminal dimerisation domain-containing protein n=1 Tax=Microctonus hyperodae TaxID=165561 RepID=A0AA39L0D8_MICHY|nr:hypothetical protein PV327_002945 [Microctonus hyperodae]
MPGLALLNPDRELTFNYVVFIARTFRGYDEDLLKTEWCHLYQDYSIEQKNLLAKLDFDDMWIQICRDSYPNLRKLVNAIRSLPNSNADSERVFSYLSDLKNKKRNKLSPAIINAICVLRSAMKMRNENAINMVLDENHLCRMTSEILYATDEKHQKCELRLEGGENDDD